MTTTPAADTAETFDPSCVRIERHRRSVTQGEVSLFYQGEKLGRFGDDVQTCKTVIDSNEPHPHDDGAVCFGGWHGRPDADWINSARYEVNKKAAAAGRIPDAPQQSQAPTDAPTTDTPMTTVRLTPGTRILVTEDSDYADGARPGNLRPARTAKRQSWQTADGEPAGILAATVVEVVETDREDGRRRYTVRTNLGDITPVTPMQRFRPVPASMRDTADVRAEIVADRAAREAEAADQLARPRDIDGTPTARGDLVEGTDQGGGGRAGRPCGVFRVLRIDKAGSPVVAVPYARAYGMYDGGEGIMFGWRRLADQTVTNGTARRSCGCPAPVRDRILPAPVDGDTAAWHAATSHTDQMRAEDRTHLPSCHWADTDDQTAPPVQRVRVVEDTTDDGDTVYTVHEPGEYGRHCKHGKGRFSGHLYDVRDRAGLLAALFPLLSFPDRTGLADRVTFADCCPLPATDDAAVVARVRHVLMVLGPDTPTTTADRARIMGHVAEALTASGWRVPTVRAARRDAWYRFRYDQRTPALAGHRIHAAYLGVDELGDVEGLHLLAEIAAPDDDPAPDPAALAAASASGRACRPDPNPLVAMCDGMRAEAGNPTPAEAGDLIELIDLGDGGTVAGHPYAVARVTEPACAGGVMYADPSGSGGMFLALPDMFRRLTDQTVTDGAARRSCGCPAPADRDRRAQGRVPHRAGCQWATETPPQVGPGDETMRAAYEREAGRAWVDGDERCQTYAEIYRAGWASAFTHAPDQAAALAAEVEAADAGIPPGDLYRYFRVWHKPTGRAYGVLGGDTRYAVTGPGFRDYGPSPTGTGVLLESAVHSHPWGWVAELTDLAPLPDGEGMYHTDHLNINAAHIDNRYPGSWRQAVEPAWVPRPMHQLQPGDVVLGPIVDGTVRALGLDQSKPDAGRMRTLDRPPVPQSGGWSRLRFTDYFEMNYRGAIEFAVRVPS